MTKTHQFLLCIAFLIFFSCTSNNQDNLSQKETTSKKIFQLKELNTRQIQSLDKSKTVVLIPGGIMEEHGPYLPSFTDGYWNEKLTDTIAKAYIYVLAVNCIKAFIMLCF